MAQLSIETEKGIALVTLDRPKVLNALNSEVFLELKACFEEMQNDGAVSTVILTGRGEKAFAAGADIKELATLDCLGAKQKSAFGQSVFRLIERFPKPVIAAVNGFALGGGCELALACHMRLASQSAQFGLPEVGLGLIPGYGGTQRLARIVGKGLALEWILSGAMIPAQRAYETGLVNQVTTAEELIPACRDLAAKIQKKGPVALRMALEAVNSGLEMTQTEGEVLESNLFGLLPSTKDTKEGLAAFLEKRKPQFQGR